MLRLDRQFAEVPSFNHSAAQNIDSIHALEAACSLAAEGGSSVKGGMRQIFKQFVERSGAQSFLKTEVEQLPCFAPRETVNINFALGGWHRTALGPYLDSRYRGGTARLRCGSYCCTIPHFSNLPPSRSILFDSNPTLYPLTRHPLNGYCSDAKPRVFWL